jgi:hypothetical protein
MSYVDVFSEKTSMAVVHAFQFPSLNAPAIASSRNEIIRGFIPLVLAVALLHALAALALPYTSIRISPSTWLALLMPATPSKRHSGQSSAISASALVSSQPPERKDIGDSKIVLCALQAVPPSRVATWRQRNAVSSNRVSDKARLCAHPPRSGMAQWPAILRSSISR